MKTTQIMKRPFLGIEVSQRTSDSYFLLSSIDRAGSLYRLQRKMPRFNVSMFMSSKTVAEFLEELDSKNKTASVVTTGRGSKSETWVHPFVMLEVAMAMAPKLKVEVYEWIYDELIKYRDNSGDSYKKMCGALYHRHPNVRTFPDLISKSALKIKAACKVDDWNSATEQQLRTRDKIHETIFIVADFVPDMEKAVDLGIARSLT